MTRDEMHAKLDALYDHVEKTKADAEAAKDANKEKLDADLEAARERVAATKANIRLGNKLLAEQARLVRDTSREKLEDGISSVKENVEKVKENVRTGSETFRDKLQANAAQARVDYAASKQARDQAKALKSVEKLEDYAADAISVAGLAVDEAACATLEAICARMTYEELLASIAEKEHNEQKKEGTEE